MKLCTTNLVGSKDGHDHAGDELLCDLHQVVVVRVGHVELAGRELGVVRHVDALVTKLLPNLVHTVDAYKRNEILIRFKIILSKNAHKNIRKRTAFKQNKMKQDRALDPHKFFTDPDPAA